MYWVNVFFDALGLFGVGCVIYSVCLHYKDKTRAYAETHQDDFIDLLRSFGFDISWLDVVEHEAGYYHFDNISSWVPIFELRLTRGSILVRTPDIPLVNLFDYFLDPAKPTSEEKELFKLQFGVDYLRLLRDACGRDSLKSKRSL